MSSLTYIGWVVQDRERSKVGAARCHIHLHARSLEGGRGGLWSEGLNDVSLPVLVQEHQGHRLLEGPLQEGVKLASHNSEEEGEMASFATPIPVHVESQA